MVTLVLNGPQWPSMAGEGGVLTGWLSSRSCAAGSRRKDGLSRREDHSIVERHYQRIHKRQFRRDSRLLLCRTGEGRLAGEDVGGLT